MSGRLVIFFLLAVALNIIHGQDEEDKRRGDEIIEIERHVDFRETIQRHGWPRPFSGGNLDEDAPKKFVDTSNDDVHQQLRGTVDEDETAQRDVPLPQKDLPTNVPPLPIRENDTVLRWLKRENVRDSGHTTTCGGSNLEVSWTPKDISKSGSLSVSIDGTAATDLTTAEMTAKITMMGVTQTFHQAATCTQMQQQYPQLKCPIKKGDSLKASTNVPSMAVLGLPTGTLTAEIKINNEKGEEFACLKASVNIVN